VSAFRGSVDFLTRFWARIQEEPNACWPWLGRLDDRPDQGYGMFTLCTRPYRAHRIAWELSNGRELDTHTFACHRCDNPPCCNPAHLFPGTVSDNNRDTAAKGRHGRANATHCPRGHPYSGDNLRIDEGRRRCVICRRRTAMRTYHLRNGNPERAAKWA
jgi:hypothetical protein